MGFWCLAKNVNVLVWTSAVEEFATALSSKGSHWEKKKKDFLDFFYSADSTLFASFVVSMTFCNVKNK